MEINNFFKTIAVVAGLTTHPTSINAQSTDGRYIGRYFNGEIKKLNEKEVEVVMRILGVSRQEIIDLERSFSFELSVNPDKDDASFLVHIGQKHGNIEITKSEGSELGLVRSQYGILNLLGQLYSKKPFSCIYQEGILISGNHNPDIYQTAKDMETFFRLNTEIGDQNVDIVIDWLEQKYFLFKQTEFYHLFYNDFSATVEKIMDLEVKMRVASKNRFDKIKNEYIRLKSLNVKQESILVGAPLLFALQKNIPLICPTEDENILHHPLHEEIAEIEAKIIEKERYISAILAGLSTKRSVDLNADEGLITDVRNSQIEVDGLISRLKELEKRVEPFVLIERERFLLSLLPRNINTITVFGLGHDFSQAIQESNILTPSQPIGLIKITLRSDR